MTNETIPWARSRKKALASVQLCFFSCFFLFFFSCYVFLIKSPLEFDAYRKYSGSSC